MNRPLTPREQLVAMAEEAGYERNEVISLLARTWNRLGEEVNQWRETNVPQKDRVVANWPVAVQEAERQVWNLFESSTNYPGTLPPRPTWWFRLPAAVEQTAERAADKLGMEMRDGHRGGKRYLTGRPTRGLGGEGGSSPERSGSTLGVRGRHTPWHLTPSRWDDIVRSAVPDFAPANPRGRDRPRGFGGRLLTTTAIHSPPPTRGPVRGISSRGTLRGRGGIFTASAPSAAITSPSPSQANSSVRGRGSRGPGRTVMFKQAVRDRENAHGHHSSTASDIPTVQTEPQVISKEVTPTSEAPSTTNNDSQIFHGAVFPKTIVPYVYSPLGKQEYLSPVEKNFMCKIWGTELGDTLKLWAESSQGDGAIDSDVVACGTFIKAYEREARYNDSKDEKGPRIDSFLEFYLSDDFTSVEERTAADIKYLNDRVTRLLSTALEMSSNADSNAENAASETHITDEVTGQLLPLPEFLKVHESRVKKSYKKELLAENSTFMKRLEATMWDKWCDEYGYKSALNSSQSGALRKEAESALQEPSEGGNVKEEIIEE